MTIHYFPVAFHPDTSSLQVRYFTDSCPEGIQYSLPIPQEQGRYPAGEQLDALIRSHMSPEQLETLVAAQNSLPVDTFVAPSEQAVLFGAGTVFIAPEQEAIFIRRPLLRVNGLPLPIEML